MNRISLAIVCCMTAASVGLSSYCTASGAEYRSAEVKVIPTVSVEVPTSVVVQKHVVHTRMFNPVLDPLAPLASGTTVDVMKQQLRNRIDSGLISGKITDSEADPLKAALEEIAVQEAEFKATDGVFTDSEAANLQRKLSLLKLTIDDAANNTNFIAYIPSVEARSKALQRRISYNLGAANLTFGEAEQLHRMLSISDDQRAAYKATGGYLSADEIETMHKDLFAIEHKLRDRVNGEILVSLPDLQARRLELVALVKAGSESGRLSLAQKELLRAELIRLEALEGSLVAHNDIEELKALAAQMDSLNFMLSQQLKESLVAGNKSPRM